MYTQKPVKAEKATLWLAAPVQDLLDITEVSPDPDCADGPEKSAQPGVAISISRRLNRYTARSLWALRADPPVLSGLAWSLCVGAFEKRTEIELFDLQTWPARVRDAAHLELDATPAEIAAALAELEALHPMQRLAVVMVLELFNSDEAVTDIGPSDLRLAISCVTHLPASACLRGDTPLPEQWKVVGIEGNQVRLENEWDDDSITVNVKRQGTDFSVTSDDFEDDPIRWGQYDPREFLGRMAEQAIANRDAAKG